MMSKSCVSSDYARKLVRELNEVNMQTRVAAFLSDYDGTLCPTDSLKNKAGIIPKELEQILWNISQQIPVCIISSKDYHFLHSRTKFARILSCIMGIETISLRIPRRVPKGSEGGKIGISNNNNVKEGCTNISHSIEESYLLPNSYKTLQINSVLLSRLAADIELEFKDNVLVERKYTADRQFLAGITADYRHLKDWRLCKNKIEPFLKEMIRKFKSSSSAGPDYLHVLTYSSHPFVDIYALYCDKGMAFDFVTSKILNIKSNGYGGARVGGILYLGDSENDNPAFRKAAVSMGIISDKRLTPKLDCQYSIDFNNLSNLLEHIVKAEFVFSEGLLMHF
jgi:hydroxymethylpyrimidine pyrophosphatase-like HAD family hydrolase